MVPHILDELSNVVISNQQCQGSVEGPKFLVALQSIQNSLARGEGWLDNPSVDHCFLHLRDVQAWVNHYFHMPVKFIGYTPSFPLI